MGSSYDAPSQDSVQTIYISELGRSFTKQELELYASRLNSPLGIAMNIAGYGFGKLEDAVGYGFQKAWGTFKEYAPSAAQTVGEAATWAGDHIGEAAGYLGEKIPDGVKDKYNDFLDSSTEEERTLMAWLSGPGAGKAASLGIEGAAKLAKGFSKLDDAASGSMLKMDEAFDSKPICLDPYTEAMSGGTNSGWAKGYLDKPVKEIEKGIKSFD